MRISRTEKHHFSMGHYEWMEVALEVEKEISDNLDLEGVTDEMNELRATIDAAMKVDIARVIGATDEVESYVHVATEWE